MRQGDLTARGLVGTSHDLEEHNWILSILADVGLFGPT